MALWIALLGILLPSPQASATAGVHGQTTMRYRGIERLLAKFDRDFEHGDKTARSG